MADYLHLFCFVVMRFICEAAEAFFGDVDG